MEKELLEEFWALGLEELKTVTQLYELKGDFINLDWPPAQWADGEAAGR